MSANNKSLWQIDFTRAAGKQKEKLPINISDILYLLKEDLKNIGPILPHWHHYGKLKSQINTYHCHLNKGKPRYVVIWQVIDKKIKIMEVNYVGTHENAPY